MPMTPVRSVWQLYHMTRFEIKLQALLDVLSILTPSFSRFLEEK